MFRLIKGVAVAACGILIFAFNAGASEDEWLIRAAPERRHAPPKTIDAAEGGTGSNAPTVPQRQSERKKPPEPDYLMGKVIWGESATFTDPRHGVMEVDDWNLAPQDVAALINRGRSVGQHYHWSNVHLDEFSYDPDRLPVLFFSGVRSLRLNESHREALRQYVLRGGTIFLDSVYGSPYFTESARKTFSEMFPGRRFRLLPGDHPLFQTYYEIDSLNYPEQSGKSDPHLEAIYIGARAGVILSPYGMGTGLTGDQEVFRTLRERGLEPRYMCKASAEALASNIVGYTIGYAEVGAIQGRPEQFGEADKQNPSDQFVFAQIRHEGAWDTHPGAAASLLMQLRHGSAIRVHMKRVAVDPGKDDLSAYPFLYLTGLDTFEFTEPERRALRGFVENGGFLLVNNGLGLSRFHQSAITELEKLLPGSELKPLPADHEIFNLLVPAGEVTYTPVLRRHHPELGSMPLLLALEHEGEVVALYSPYDLEAGWLNTDFPLMRGYENQSAQRLGLNIVAYSMIR